MNIDAELQQLSLGLMTLRERRQEMQAELEKLDIQLRRQEGAVLYLQAKQQAASAPEVNGAVAPETERVEET